MFDESLGADPDGVLVPNGFSFPTDLFVGFPLAGGQFVTRSSRQGVFFGDARVSVADLVHHISETPSQERFEVLRTHLLTMALTSLVLKAFQRNHYYTEGNAADLIPYRPRLRSINYTYVLSVMPGDEIRQIAFWRHRDIGCGGLSARDLAVILRACLRRTVRTYEIPWDGWWCLQPVGLPPDPRVRPWDSNFYDVLREIRQARLQKEAPSE